MTSGRAEDAGRPPRCKARSHQGPRLDFEAMNASSASAPPDVDEFALAGLEKREAERIGVPYVASAPAVFECRLEREPRPD
jgi:hypothetical protein